MQAAIQPVREKNTDEIPKAIRDEIKYDLFKGDKATSNPLNISYRIGLMR